MCNEAARRVALGQIRDDFNAVGIPLRFPEGLPNLAPVDSVRITDTTLIVRAAPDGGVDAVQRRWSWPGARGKPVYNYRSEGRRFANGAHAGRCLIPFDGFYEFTTPADPKAKRKDKWFFTPASGAAFLCIAGLWRSDPALGEAFTMLTSEPGPDVAPYHARQVVVMPPQHWGAWLSGAGDEAQLLAPAPAGTLNVARAV